MYMNNTQTFPVKKKTVWSILIQQQIQNLVSGFYVYGDWQYSLV